MVPFAVGCRARSQSVSCLSASAVVGAINGSDCVNSNVVLSSLWCLAQRQFCGGAQAAWDAVTVLDLMHGCEMSVYVPMRPSHHVNDTMCHPVQTCKCDNLTHCGSQGVRTLPLLVRFGHVAAL